MDLNASEPKSKNKNLNILIFVIFAAGFLLGLGALWFAQWRFNLASKRTSAGSEATADETDYPDFALDKEVAVFLVYWDQDKGFEDIKNNTDKISAVYPFWYEMQADGSIEYYTGAEDEEIIEFCKNNNIKIIPVITNDHDPDRVETLFADSNKTQTHINTIVSLVEDNGYDGVEIDYESLEATDREDYSDFMTNLSTKIHADGKLLATAVHAKTSDQGTWGGPAAQDWLVLGEVCDAIKIMTYDFHWSTSAAGDIAPLSWMEEVYDYAETVLPKEKVHVGIHFYGYDWVDELATDLTYEDVQELITEYNPSVKTSSEGEKYFTYSKKGKTHTVYFADHETIANRVELANDYDFAGIGIWRLGGEDLLNWTTIEEAF